LKELVAPDFPETKLGKYLLATFVERDPWLNGESIGQIFRARGGTDMTSRLGSMKTPTLVINGEYDNSLAAGKNSIVDPRCPQDSAQDRARSLHRRSRRFR
jgi:pimeloyl-ACP methyl ester carboxylesterase